MIGYISETVAVLISGGVSVLATLALFAYIGFLSPMGQAMTAAVDGLPASHERQQP